MCLLPKVEWAATREKISCTSLLHVRLTGLDIVTDRPLTIATCSAGYMMHMSSAWHILGRSEQETKQCRDEEYHIYFELALTLNCRVLLFRT